jgi:hypothetical protein
MAEEMSPSDTEKKKKRKGTRLPRLFLLSFIPFVIFSIGLFPVVLLAVFYFRLFLFHRLLDFLLLPFFIVFEMLFLFVIELLFSGAIIRSFHIYYSEGTYGYSVRDNTTFKWMLICQLYTPMRKLLEIIPMGGLQRTYLRLLGMHIGKNSLVGGTIKDPCLTGVGDNTTIGEYAVIYAHIHDYEKRTITFKKITIESGCVIGAGSILMPGVVVQDHAVVAAGAIVPKNRILESNKIYAGNPAHEIVKTEKPTQ